MPFIRKTSSAVAQTGCWSGWIQTPATFYSAVQHPFHGAYEGGLVEHSLNVYECLKDYLSRPRTKDLYGMDYTPETIAVTALLTISAR